MAVSSVTYNKPILPRTTDTSDLGSNRASVYSGKGLSFDGVNDYVQGSSGASLPNSNYTICSWFNMDTLKTHGIISWGDDTTGERRGMIVWNGSPPGYYCLRSSTYGSNPYGSTELKAGVWYFGAVTVDSSGNASIYLNGELDGTGTNTLNAFTNTDFVVGNTRSNEWFDGKISSTKVFDVVLTAAQVKELYENPEQAVPTGVSQTSLILHLPMTEGNGSYLYNANQGALGTELISNGGFDETCQKWGTTDSTDVEIVNGKAIWTNAPLSGSFVKQPLDLEIGKFYRVSFDYTSTAFNIFVNLGDTQQAVPLGNGRASFDMYYGSGDSSLSFQHGYLSASSATVDNVSVKEVVPKYIVGAINGATWVKNLPEPLPQTALLDWNKYDRKYAENSTDIYSGTVTVPSISGTIVCRHIPEPVITDNRYVYSLGTNSIGYQRALRQISSKYGFVSYGSGSSEDFDTGIYYSTGVLTDIAFSWDATKYVNVHVDGIFVNSVYTSGLNDITGSRTVVLNGANFGTGVRGTIAFWAYYDRVLTTQEISDIHSGAVNPEDVADLEYYFTKQNGYSYNGVTLTKGGGFQESVMIQGANSGKDWLNTPISLSRSANSYNFDGNSYVSISDNETLYNGNTFTVEAWIYPSSDQTGTHRIINKWDTGYPQRTFQLSRTARTIFLYISNGSNALYAETGNDITYDAWNHVVGTYDGSTIRVYVNAVEEASFATGSYTLKNSTEPILIGAYSTLEESYDKIANPRIYNYALTAEQVADNYNQKVSTFGGTKATSEMDAYIARTVAAGATVEAHSCVINYLTELDKK